MTTRSKAGIFKSKVYSTQCQQYRMDPIRTEPNDVLEAMSNNNWREAMEEEYKSLIRNKTWKLVPSLANQKVIGNKWVFRIKRDIEGRVLKHKARLVAKGFLQTSGVDYHETFSPVIKASTLRIILTITVSRGWSVKQVDINNAFLNGKLNEVVFMNQPEGFVDKRNPTFVCRLEKALYGLKQVPRAWYERPKMTLLEWKFTNSRADSSLFFFMNHKHVIFCLVYVDDIVVTRNDHNLLQSFIDRLNAQFALKDMGELHHFLGVEVKMNESRLHLTQTKYIRDLLKRFNLEHLKPCAIPMTVGKYISKDDGEKMLDFSLYRSAIGGLQYLSHTRPDISFAVNKLSQFLQAPSDIHWKAVKRIFRYLKGTIKQGIWIQRTDRIDVTGFADADWASCPDDRRSTAGYCVYLGDTLVSWSSKKQQFVARSSTKSEYRALAHVSAKITWIESLLKEINLQPASSPILWCDNLSASVLASNPVYHARTKHIELDIHFVRDKVLEGKLKIQYIPSSDQTADLMTKPLSQTRFLLLKDKLGVKE